MSLCLKQFKICFTHLIYILVISIGYPSLAWDKFLKIIYLLINVKTLNYNLVIKIELGVYYNIEW